MRWFVLPDEDAWDLPEEWWRGLHPRRGGRPVEVADPAGGAERLRDHLSTTRGKVARERVVGRWIDYDQALLAAGTRHLEAPGADPVAAAVAALTVGGDGTAAAALVDAWVELAGVRFAARAVGEAFRLVDSRALWTAPAPSRAQEPMWRGEDLQRAYAVARVLRRHLAAASDDDYAQVTDDLAGYRTSPAGRIITSYLLPARVDWVDADCAAVASRAGAGEARSADLAGVLVLAASRPGHLEHLRGAVTGSLLGREDPGVVATVLDGVGPAAVSFVTEPFYLALFRLHDDSRQRPGPAAVRILAATPADDALRALLGCTLDQERIRPGELLASGALARYPLRALRVLAERDDAVSRDLFGGIVLSEPRLIPHLAGPVRARAEEIVASGGAGIGAGWASLLDDADGRHQLDTADDVKRAVGALAAIPAEEAFGLLADRADRKHFRPALKSAAKRDPALAARVLAARDTPAAADLLREHLHAFPGSASALVSPDPSRGAESNRSRPEPDPSRAGSGRSRAESGAGAPASGLLATAPARPPVFPDWLNLAGLPAVTIRDTGETLTAAAVRRLCQLLALSKIGAPRPEIAEVRASCVPHELSRVGWAIFEQWQAAGYPPKNDLGMTALAALGDDTTVPALTELFPSWSRVASRVRTGMDVLTAIGTDRALRYLHRLSRKARTSGSRRLAADRLAGVAEARGLRPEQLADRIVPDLGLGADGRAVLDYGPRRFTAGFDAQLQPRIATAAGRWLPRLPRPAAADDPVLAPAAYRRFTEMRKEAKEVAGERIPALEHAMVTGRRWTAAEFRALFLHHPLMWHLTHRLLWATFDERDSVTAVFRAAEDRSLADLDDKAWQLDDAATVGVPHPWHFTADRDAWSEVFADYAIIQPFPQLGRELITPAEVDAASFAGTEVAGRKLFALASKGWRFGDRHVSLLRDWPRERDVPIEGDWSQPVQIVYSPGYHWQEPDLPRHLTVVHGLDGLGPIAFSEVIRDVRYLTSGG